MPEHTPLPASGILALADKLLWASSRVTRWYKIEEEYVSAKREDARELLDAAEAYRTARVASPVTLEEVLMIRSCHAYNDYIFARDLPGNGDPDELLAKYNAAHRAQAEHAATLSVEAYGKESDARRLAGEGGA